MIKTKHITQEPREEDGIRVLVVNEWPEDFTRGDLRIDAWMKDLAPNKNLQKILEGGDWEGFKTNFFRELKEKEDMLQNLKNMEALGSVTLVHDSNEDKNTATALKEYIEEKVRNV